MHKSKRAAAVWSSELLECSNKILRWDMKLLSYFYFKPTTLYFVYFDSWLWWKSNHLQFDKCTWTPTAVRASGACMMPVQDGRPQRTYSELTDKLKVQTMGFQKEEQRQVYSRDTVSQLLHAEQKRCLVLYVHYIILSISQPSCCIYVSWTSMGCT